MTSEDPIDLSQMGSDWLDEMLARPPECSELDMELKTAIERKDLAGCRELLREKGKWLSEFKGHELAQLMDAAIKTDAIADQLLDFLLESGVPAHTVYDHIGEDYQHTPLITAARCGRLDLIRKLVAAGADLHWKSPTGTNALSEILPSNACQAPARDTPELAHVRELLVARGLRIDPLCADSRRKLLWASRQPESWQDIPALLDLGIPSDETGWSPFMLKLATGHTDLHAVAILSKEELQHRDAWKRTPFLLAVVAGNLQLAKALMERGSDIFALAHCGASALHLAAEYDHCPLIEWLLQNGLALDKRDEFGDSALHSAVSSNSLQAAALLIQKGADVAERDENGYSLIHGVCYSDDLSMLKLLIDAGASMNDVSGGGNWPLRDACEAGNSQAVKYLLQIGADPNLTSTGETALFAAVSSDSIDCLRLLLQAGADVNATDCDGWTCLFHLRSETVAQFLLDNGASPGTSDQCGGLPEDWSSVPITVRKMLKDWRLNSCEK